MSALGARAAALLGASLEDEVQLHGGDLSQVFRLALSDGRSVVAKASATAQAEAGMLGAIASAGAPAPRVLAAERGLLVMEDLGRDDGPSGAWADLGRALRSLHSATGAGYGWPEDHGFGPVPIPNAPLADWPKFWGERRLLPSCPELPPALARRIEALAGRLADLLPSAPPPALLHGDLWTGNVMARGKRVTGLIDPACYHGHAEVDLAMLALFGAPGPAFRDTYGEPDRGEAARQPLYQLWPALVHLRLFGRGYLGLVEGCLAAAERA